MHINLIQEPLGQVAVLMRKQDVAVGIDTGVMQLATAMGVPSTTLFLNAQLARNWYTQENYSYIVTAGAKSDNTFWATWEQGDTTTPGYNDIMNTITPFSVADSARRALRETGKLRFNEASVPQTFDIPAVLRAMRRWRGR